MKGRLCALATGLLMCVTALAHRVEAQGRILLVNEFLVCRLCSAQKARTVAQRLSSLRVTADVEAQTSGNTAYVTVSGHQVVEVSPIEAKQNNIEPKALADVWASRLKTAITAPAVQFDKPSISVPVGKSVRVGMFGSAVRESAIVVSDGAVVRAKKIGGSVSILALKSGTAEVTAISPSGAKNTMQVDTKELAAQFPQYIKAAVSGNPAQPQTIEGAIQLAVRSQLKAAADADIKLLDFTPYPLGATESRQYQIHARAIAKDCFTSEGIVNVTIRNVGLPPADDAELWYCNDPESVKKAGPLFANYLGPGHQARMLYHHVNASNDTLFLKITLINASDAPASVVLVPGDSDPQRDPLVAGIQAAEQFMAGSQTHSGEIVTIPPQSSIPISTRQLFPGQTVSGLCSIRSLSKDQELLVRVDAVPPFSLDTNWAAAIHTNSPWHYVGPFPADADDSQIANPTEFIYPNPAREMSVTYAVGGKPKFIRLGQEPIRRKDLQDGLDGNFGVTYDINATIANPTKQPADIELSFEASAGYCAGLFYIDYKTYRTPYLSPHADVQVMKIHLAPDEVRHLAIRTIPISGGTFPATLSIRPVGCKLRYRDLPPDERR
ncbi:MAG: hypothetical protein JSS72_11455 [Armatimonadetes bacterium]|nr:hypothetical protein [Armatimonadota bacterium]